mgnify:CR=1 FL=1
MVEVKTSFGLHLTYKAYKWDIDLYVPRNYHSKMEGLCGNWNDNSDDDCQNPAGEDVDNIPDWGQSWNRTFIGDGKPETCTGGLQNPPECTDEARSPKINLMMRFSYL